MHIKLKASKQTHKRVHSGIFRPIKEAKKMDEKVKSSIKSSHPLSNTYETGKKTVKKMKDDLGIEKWEKQLKGKEKHSDILLPQFAASSFDSVLYPLSSYNNMGYSSTSFRKGSLRSRSSSSDINIGGTELITQSEARALTLLQSNEHLIAFLEGNTDIDQLTNHFNKVLMSLETANIHSLTQSDTLINSLVHGLDSCSRELEDVNTWLSYYDAQLGAIQKSIQEIEDNNYRMEVLSKNQRSLKEEVEQLLYKFSLDEDMVNVITFGDFSIGERLELACKASIWLDKRFAYARATTLHDPRLMHMASIKSQMEEFHRLKTVFADRIKAFLISTFESIQEIMDGGAIGTPHPLITTTTTTTTVSTDGLEMFPRIQEHTGVHNQLLPYSPLIKWMQRNSPENKGDIVDKYLSVASVMYQREFKVYFSNLNKSYLRKDTKPPKLTGGGGGGGGEGREGRIIGGNDQLFDRALSGVIELALKEQKFLREFLQMGVGGVIHDHVEGEREKWEDILVSLGKKEEEKEKEEEEEKEVNEESILNESLLLIIGDVEKELKELLQAVAKQHYFYLIPIIDKLEEYFSKYSGRCKKVMIVVTELIQQVKVLFSGAMDGEIKALSGVSGSLKKGGGILPPVQAMGPYIQSMETFIQGLGGRHMVEPAYLKLLVQMQKWVRQVASNQGPKHQHFIIIDNFYSIVQQVEDTLGPQPGTGEDEGGTSLQREIEDNMRALAKQLMEQKKTFRPLTTFFTSLDKLLRTLPAEEVQFQSTHSPDQCATLLRTFSRGKIEKRLLGIAKKIRDRCSPGLGPVVWTHFKDYFVSEYTRYEMCLRQCYTNQFLPISSSELLGMMENIDKIAK